MRIRYKGISSPSGYVKSTGCSSCGGSTIGRTKMSLVDPYSYFYQNRQFTFYIGREYDVPDELGEVLLRKYSYVNGNKMYAFEELL